jgi:hypothetical protein
MTLLESPAGFIDWFYADVEIVSFLGGLGCSGDFYSSWCPNAGRLDVVDEERDFGFLWYALESFTVFQVPAAEVEVVSVEFEEDGHDVCLLVLADECQAC